MWPVVRRRNDEIGETGSKIGGGDVEHCPEADLASSFVEEEDVFEKSNRYDLTTGEEQCRDDSHSIIGFVFGRARAADLEAEAEDGCPEEYRSAAPDGAHWHPNQTTNTTIRGVSVLLRIITVRNALLEKDRYGVGIICSIRSDVPLRSLWEDNGRSSCRGDISCQCGPCNCKKN